MLRRLGRIEDAADRSRTDISNASVNISNIGIHIANMQRELAEEKAARIAAERKAEEEIDRVRGELVSYIQSQVVNKKAAFYSGYLPALFAFAAIACTVFLAFWGPK